MEFEKLYLKHMLEAKANNEEVGKRVYDELTSYINTRKKDMTPDAISLSRRMIKDISGTLDPDTILDDLAELGNVVGLQKSFSRLVGRVITIVDEIEDEESMIQNLIGEPEAEPEPEMEPEMEPEGEDELGLEPEENEDELNLEPEEDEEEEEDKLKI